MIDVAHPRSTAAGIRPRNLGAGVDRQRERIEGPAAAGDRHVRGAGGNAGWKWARGGTGVW